MKATPEELYATARDLTTDLYPRLHDLVPATTNQVSESQIGKTKGTTKFVIPWNGPAADLHLDIHAACRRHESALTLLLWGKATFRGGPDEITLEVINRLPVLLDHAAAAGHDTPEVDAIARDLISWAVRIRAMLDEARDGEAPWVKAPGGLTCPHCGARLELPPTWHRLANPDLVCRTCTDEHGKHLTWPASDHLDHAHPDDLITEQTARERFALSTSVLRVWKHRGKIHPYGEDDHGRKLYRTADITALVENRAKAVSADEDAA